MKQRSQAKQYRQAQLELSEYIDVDGFKLVGEERRPRILTSALAARNVKAALARPLLKELIAPEDAISIADGTRQVLTDRAAAVAFDGLCGAVNAMKNHEVEAVRTGPARSALERQRDALGHLVVRNGMSFPLADNLSEVAREYAKFLDAVSTGEAGRDDTEAPVQSSSLTV